ncbi:hypothetical protein [Streptomyces sp. NPDC088137]|uniref:hypothetical protein n=1 Tax=Streptomyces sp. NPDC088137 TaxID=3365827 RepID=UPI00382D2AA2
MARYPAVLAQWMPPAPKAVRDPRLIREVLGFFAVVQELGDCEDAVVAAWGLGLDGRTEPITAEGVSRLSVRTPESALRFFRSGDGIRTRLIWPLNLN